MSEETVTVEANELGLNYDRDFALELDNWLSRANKGRGTVIASMLVCIAVQVIELDPEAGKVILSQYLCGCIDAAHKDKEKMLEAEARYSDDTRH